MKSTGLDIEEATQPSARVPESLPHGAGGMEIHTVNQILTPPGLGAPTINALIPNVDNYTLLNLLFGELGT